ncbi:restriction modification system DNA specificity domain-containing protein [Acidithiobacillus ferrivorans SS3]|uniref:Restriction modification system DNA specificity domain-containing protein n=1 Tax=Acidithiobacillus ferrivorans SS3 TaxID=743299 RepID=G0JQV6_9PROT|nr:restriction endonuclease subunit S [Acidithiobacillus ferrivorans]AEM46400.1 restriction modification system DNA specificity domain-containing protein [Acidithiobacillus ferrivorans SS3]OFA16187.1 restriction endonuclease subunit S [Acidithiobacillus ferrivorans]
MTMPWLTLALEELASVQRGKFSARPRNDPRYYGGDIPFIQTGDVANGAGRVRSYSQTLNTDGLSVSKLFPKGSLVVTIAANIGDVAKVEFDFACPDSLVVVQANEDVNSDWLQYSLESKKELLDSLAPQNAQKNINLEILRPLALDVPPLAEQKRIAGAIKTWDTAIQKTEQLIAAKERHYSHELSRLISRCQHPHAHVGAFAEEVSARNRGGNEARVLSVTNSRGFVLPEDQFERRVASADLSNYKVVRRGQYAYNPSRINVGSIARLNGWDDGVLSPMYVVFRLDEAKVDSNYFLHWLNSHEVRQRIKNSAQGSVRETVSFSEFAALTIPLPDTDKQTAIARYLNALREEIDLLGQSVTALKTQKRGLMQKLLTGEWRLLVPAETDV